MIFIPEVMFCPGRMRMRKFLDEVLVTLTTEPIQDVDDSVARAVSTFSYFYGIIDNL